MCTILLCLVLGATKQVAREVYLVFLLTCCCLDTSHLNPTTDEERIEKEEKRQWQQLTLLSWVCLMFLLFPTKKRKRKKKIHATLLARLFQTISFLPHFFVEAALDMLHNACYTYMYSRKDSFIHSFHPLISSTVCLKHIRRLHHHHLFDSCLAAYLSPIVYLPKANTFIHVPHTHTWVVSLLFVVIVTWRDGYDTKISCWKSKRATMMIEI